jgi:hypothetical protein
MPLLSHLTMVSPREECLVENAFEILKKLFCELHGKIKLHITMILNLITCCCILHNMLFGWQEINIDNILHILELKTITTEVTTPQMQVPCRQITRHVTHKECP